VSATSTTPVAVITAAQIDAVISHRPILSSSSRPCSAITSAAEPKHDPTSAAIVSAELRVEAVLLTMLVFLGVNGAWLLLVDEA
jgi:hypothetical protein